MASAVVMVMKETTMPVNTELLKRDEFSLLSCMVPVGSSVGSENHNVTGPCNLTDLTEAAMDYWALGHIHKSQVLSEGAS